MAWLKGVQLRITYRPDTTRSIGGVAAAATVLLVAKKIKRKNEGHCHGVGGDMLNIIV